MNHDEIDYNIYKDEKDEWLDYVKQDVFFVLLSLMLDIVKQWKKLLELV